MGDTPTFQSNPYGSFDPSQWSNPYSNYYGKALPWPATYAGTPTDAMGRPIAAPPGMTLNSTPAQPQQAATQSLPALGSGARAMYDAGYGDWSQLDPLLGRSSIPGQVAGQGQNVAGGGMSGATQPAAAAAAPNNWQQTLSMLANPGKVTTPGATVPQAAATAGQPSQGVLQNFLANWQPASSGAGSGFTQNFNTILRGLQAQKGS
jgi:hypothetical protein